MELNLKPDLQEKVDRWTSETGRPVEELVADAMAGCFNELARVSKTLDSRYDDIKNGRVKLVDGEEALAGLRRKNHAVHTDRR